MGKFFTENYDAIQSFSEKLAGYQAKSDEQELKDVLVEGVNAITSVREEYDEIVVYTVLRMGEGFKKIINSELNSHNVERTLHFVASFIREATLVRAARSSSEQVVIDYFLGVKIGGQLGDWHGFYIDYIRNVLPTALIEEQRKGIVKLRSDLDKDKSDFLTYIGDLELRISGYKQQLENISSEYNFVGLSHAFGGILRKKKSERVSVFIFLLALGFLAILVPGVVIFFNGSLLGDVVDSRWSPLSISKLVASVGAEVVILYYFRVVLRLYLVVKNQITNLQLRNALCSFIEEYLDFSERAAKGSRSAAISAFESLIFGVLPSDDPKLPATLDGVEQIAKLVKSVRTG